MQVKTKNILIAALAVALVLLLWYRVIYSPMQSQASKANTATKEAEARVKTLQAQVDAANGTTKKKAGQPNASDFKAALPETTAEAQLLRDINSVLGSAGVAWQAVTPGSPTTAGSLTTINIGITAGGTYSQLMKAVSNLLALKRLLVIDTVGITESGAAPGSNSSNSLQLQVTGRAFAQASAPAAGSTTGTAGASGSTPAGSGTPAASTNG